MTSRHGPAPEQWTTHRLLSIATRLNELRLNRRLAKLGLTTSALDALETAAALEPTTVTDLAATLCVSRQSMGKVLRRLQSLGFLTKEPARDGRSADLRLTPEGHEVLSAAEDLISDGTGAEGKDDVLFRRQLEQHIRDLRKAELNTITRHPAKNRQPQHTTGSGHRQEPRTPHLKETGATLWLQQTGLPEPKQTYKRQPRQ
ncbi:MarR family winged helix-turn-helix transcriptional regulator [Arthrobacter sp. D3-16]